MFQEEEEEAVEGLFCFTHHPFWKDIEKKMFYVAFTSCHSKYPKLVRESAFHCLSSMCLCGG